MSPSGGNSPAPGSTSISRRASDENHSYAHNAGYNMSDLTRVPSYGHALRTSGYVTPLNDGPPTYIQATSRPSSPHQRPTQPSQAHLRSADGSPSRAGSSSLANGITTLELDDSTADGMLRVPPRSHRGSRSVHDESEVQDVRNGL